jgi:choline dehydrogenase
MNDPETFDYVVIGGGSAGCVAAGELSSDPAATVLVLEAGPAAEDHPETLSADGYKYAFINDQVIWERFSVPQPHCGDQRVFMGSGTVLGGSGSVNGMVYTRGAVEDFDQWPRGWQWDDVRPDFEALESRLRPRCRPPTRWSEACISAAVACGFEHRDGLNDGNLSNVVGHEWMTYEGDRRRSSYVAFVQDAGRRPNLQIRPHARVQRIVFDQQRRAVAVEYRWGDELRRVNVGREVVMAAGALETPKLLMVSGVGPGQALRFHDIEVVHALEGVGQNLHDHPNVPLFFLGRHRVDCHYPQLYSFYRTNPDTPLPTSQSDTCYVFWPAPSAMKQAVQRMLPGKVLPPALYDGPLKGVVRGAAGAIFGSLPARRAIDHLFGIVVILGKPFSRGSVRLQSPRADDPARLDPAYFSDPRDMETMVRGIHMARKLSRSGGLRAWNSRELMPGPWNRSDAALAEWVGNNAITTYHFAGTCRMGEHDHAVCDTRLRLRGVQGVRIADASAVPFTPVSAMNAPSMLVGYRAAKYLQQAARERLAS